MPELRICPECGEDFGAWPGDDADGVWAKDGQRYCSAECVIYRWRKQHIEARDA